MSGNIHEYCDKGNIEYLKNNCQGCDFNEKDQKDKYTPLMWAAKSGHPEVIEYLISHCGAEVNITGGWNESTALMKAAENGHCGIVKLLLSKNAKIDVQNDFGSTALMLACERGRLEVATCLVENKADKNIQNELEYTALILAAENGYNDIIQMLCENKAKLDIKNQFGKTALIMAAEMGHFDCVQTLCEAGADFNAISKRGVTALMLSSVKGYEKIVKYLTEVKKCRLSIQNVDGDTALTMVSGSAHSNIVECLLLAESDKALKNKKGNNALMAAAERGQLANVKLLLDDYENANIVLDDDGRGSDGGVGSDELHVEYNPTDGMDEINNEGSTALLLSASNGHLNVMTYLMNRGIETNRGSDINYQNNNGLSAIKALSNFYIKNEHKFTDFITMASEHHHLMDMLPTLLPAFQSPNAVLNQHFSRLLLGLKNIKNEDHDIVRGLVQIAAGLKLSASRHPLEAIDTTERLSFVEKMLLECMASDSMDKQDNVVQVLQCRKNHRRGCYDNYVLSRARAFVSGPLEQCIEHKLLSMLGTAQVSTYVDKVFYSFLKKGQVHKIHNIKDLFQMRSNCIYLRTCPAALFFLEAFSKCLMLALVSYLSIGIYDMEDRVYQKTYDVNGTMSNTYHEYQFFVINEPGHNGGYVELAVIIMFAANILHELGEMQETNWSISDHFEEIWNFLDLFGIIFLLLWCLLSAFHFHQEIANILLNVASVPLSMGLLRYLSINRSLGVLVLTVFAMGFDLSIFVVVMFMCVFGFGLAFHGIFPNNGYFNTVEMTIRTLFDASLGQHDFTIFDDEPIPAVGVALLFTYICLTMVVLLNLVIARMSATHNKIDDNSFQTWSMMRAKNVQEFLLVKEKSPLCMLPAPFNLISVAVMPIHYFCIWRATNIQKAKKLQFIQTRHRQQSQTNMKPFGRNHKIFYNSEKEEDGKIIENKYIKKTKIAEEYVMSVSGTVSDMVVSLFALIPCAFLEIFFCLKDMRQRANDPYTFWIIAICFLFISPLLFVIFLLLLLYKIMTARSILLITDSGTELSYIQKRKKNDDNLRKDTNKLIAPPPPKNDHSNNNNNNNNSKHIIKMSVKVIRGKIIKQSKYDLFTKTNLYATLKLNEQFFQTPAVDVNGANTEAFWSKEKEFIIREDDSRNLLIRLFDQEEDGKDRILGVAKVQIDRWIANGRFEGNIDIHEKHNETNIVGSVSLAVKRVTTGMPNTPAVKFQKPPPAAPAATFLPSTGPSNTASNSTPALPVLPSSITNTTTTSSATSSTNNNNNNNNSNMKNSKRKKAEPNSLITAATAATATSAETKDTLTETVNLNITDNSSTIKRKSKLEEKSDVEQTKPKPIVLYRKKNSTANSAASNLNSNISSTGTNSDNQEDSKLDPSISSAFPSNTKTGSTTTLANKTSNMGGGGGGHKLSITIPIENKTQTTTLKKSDESKNKIFFTPADRERIFHGVENLKQMSSKSTNGFSLIFQIKSIIETHFKTVEQEIKNLNEVIQTLKSQHNIN